LTLLDIHIVDGDISLSSWGEPQLSVDQDAIVRGFLRRLTTPLEGFKRYFRTTSGAVLLDEEYGSDLISYRGIEKSVPLINEMINIIKDTAVQDGRVSLVNVEAIDNANTSTISFKLEFSNNSDQIIEVG
jgi:hypothetical protein